MRKMTTGPAKRYAKALFELANENGVSYVEQLNALASAVNDNEELSAALASPCVSSKEKVGVLAGLATEVKADDVLTNFLKLLGEHGRADILVDVAAWMESFDREKNGVVVARVQSAQQLTASQRDGLTAFIKNESKDATDVVLEEEVDESLIAGVRLYVGAKEFDTTVRGRLNGLKLALNG